jgi:hypothetical protein
MKEYIKMVVIILVVVIVYDKFVKPNVPFLSSLEEEI